ncbi:hypothetical protein DFP73DRAFT_486720 [Morchella snyderi]|nr:hypothetical protein DFP73DRAFT_486720 [Morchella snyderi]
MQEFPPSKYPLPSVGSYFPDSYSNSGSAVSSAASTPAGAGFPVDASTEPTRRSTRSTVVKKHSISSLLSSPDSVSSDSSGVSSPLWSEENSPTTASTSTRSSSVASGPWTPAAVQTNYRDSFEVDLSRRRGSLLGFDHMDMMTDQKVGADINGAKRKSRSSPRTSTNSTRCGGDEYDVLGRKKPKTPRTPMSWDPQDDILLKQLKEEQRLGWKEIATHFPGRTSHACQFRWRRLASGTLKYYHGHRRPPVVTTTSSSFASEMASTAAAGTISNSPKLLMSCINNQSPAPVTNPSTPQMHHSIPPSMPHYALSTSESPIRQNHYYQSLAQQRPWGHSGYSVPMHTYQAPQLPSPASSSPRYLEPWTPAEDEILVNKGLSFNEVNILLSKRSEKEICDRMAKLRSEKWLVEPMQHNSGLSPVADSRMLRSQNWDGQ